MDREAFLLRAARRARQEPSFLGSVLARYQERYGLTDAMLARELGVDELAVARLALCGLPRPNSFAEDVRAIAERTGVSPLQLARILREEQLGWGLRREDLFNLRAARWREEDEEP
jgi:transcriptional regulator with XRE-family HTH domain